jgi:hypothetical protein
MAGLTYVVKKQHLHFRQMLPLPIYASQVGKILILEQLIVNICNKSMISWTLARHNAPQRCTTESQLM